MKGTPETDIALTFLNVNDNEVRLLARD